MSVLMSSNSDAENEQQRLTATTPRIALAIKLLTDIFEHHNIPESHGIVHALSVTENARRALDCCTNIPEKRKELILLAALLHDADDRKYWPRDSRNAESILQQVIVDDVDDQGDNDNKQDNQDSIDLVLRMIDYVSCSKNKNSIPSEAIDHPELLYPRYADRLEALGEIGVFRCWHYAYEKKGDLFLDSTPRPKSVEEIYSAAKGRFEQYHGNYSSMMDHFYDKLLHLADFSVSGCDNSFFIEEARKRRQIIEEVCLHFGLTGQLHPLIEKYEKDAKDGRWSN